MKFSAPLYYHAAKWRIIKAMEGSTIGVHQGGPNIAFSSLYGIFAPAVL